MAPCYSQLVNDIRQKNTFKDYGFTIVTRKGTNGNPEHKATFYYRGAPIVTSLHWHRTFADARNETARYIRPVLEQALSDEIPVSVYDFPYMASYIMMSQQIREHCCSLCLL